MIRRTPELLAKVRALYIHGASTRDVGRAMGFSFATARNLLMEMGVQRRRPGRSRRVPLADETFLSQRAG